MTEQEIASFLTPDEVAVYSRLLSRPDARLPVSVFATIAELRCLLRAVVAGTQEQMSASFDPDTCLVTAPWECDCGAIATSITQDVHDSDIQHTVACWQGRVVDALAGIK